MKTVKITKQFSIRQMCNMADNLRDHYKAACRITVESFAYSDVLKKTVPEFILHIASNMCSTNLSSVSSWESLQDKYLYYISIDREDTDE